MTDEHAQSSRSFPPHLYYTYLSLTAPQRLTLQPISRPSHAILPSPPLPATAATPMTPARFKLIFYVPPAAVSACKSAIFAAGAGSFPGKGGYTECAFTTKGVGQFRPGDGANPHVCFDYHGCH